jgi:uncharacterized protein (DUF924 family)
MPAPRRRWASELLHFRFRRLHPHQWFARNSSVDAELRKRFTSNLDALALRAPREFLGDSLTARAAILLFDQLPRNLHRGDAKAFAHDALAVAITRGAISRGWDRTLGEHERHFLYMPLMHSEAIADQRLALQVFAGLRDKSILHFARQHYRMVARFGRFPHRNAALGRTSSLAELRAIAQGNSW